MQRFGEKLKTLRKANKMTLKDLTSALGYVGFGYMSEIETGKRIPTVELVLKVASYFNVTTDQLLKDEIELDVANNQNS